MSPKKLQRSLEEEVAFTKLQSGAHLVVKDICNVLMAFHALAFPPLAMGHLQRPSSSTRGTPSHVTEPHPRGFRVHNKSGSPLDDKASTDDREAEEGTTGKVPKVGKRLRYRQPTEDQDMLVDKDNVPAVRPSPYDTFKSFILRPGFDVNWRCYMTGTPLHTLHSLATLAGGQVGAAKAGAGLRG